MKLMIAFNPTHLKIKFGTLEFRNNAIHYKLYVINIVRRKLICIFMKIMNNVAFSLFQ